MRTHRTIAVVLLTWMAPGCSGESMDTIEADPCAGRECGSLANGSSCGMCEASGVPSYSPDTTTYCNELAGLCGGIEIRCLNGWCEIPAGSFQAGWDFIATLPMFEPAPHRVRLTRPYRIQQTEVTQGQWLQLMATNPSPFVACGPNCPVSGMSWFDAVIYANRLSEREGIESCYRLVNCDKPLRGDHWWVCDRVEFKGLDCPGYRLPTEYEWEHAARAGSPACYSDAQLDAPAQQAPCALRADADDNAWYCGNSDVDYSGCVMLGTRTGSCAGPHPVGAKRPNRFGLDDMYGNVTELTTSLWRWPKEIPTSGGTELVDPFADGVVLRDDFVTERGGFFAWGISDTCAARRSPSGARNVENSDVLGFTGFRLVQTRPSI